MASVGEILALTWRGLRMTSIASICSNVRSRSWTSVSRPSTVRLALKHRIRLVFYTGRL